MYTLIPTHSHTRVLCHRSINASELGPTAGLAPLRCEHVGGKRRKRTCVHQPSGCQPNHYLANGKRHGTGGPMNAPERGTRQLVGATLFPQRAVTFALCQVVVEFSTGCLEDNLRSAKHSDFAQMQRQRSVREAKVSELAVVPF